MSLPKISIITPSFNQGKFIEETILSVINQNYPNLEYIIIDGGSTDNTIDIIKKYENKISYWISEKDKGQSDAINKGFKVASGEIIGWLNSDDLYLRPDISRNDEKSTLLCVAEAFTKNPEIDLIYGDVENFNDKGETEYYHVNEFEPLDFLKRVSIHQPSVFWRKKIIEETGYLDENLHYTMDYDLWMRIFFTYKTLKINKIISKFRIHNSSKTNSNPKDMYMEYRKVFSRFICSIEKTKYIELLKELRIYDNSENIVYKINYKIEDHLIDKAIQNYINNCIVQEYTFGNIKNTNRLILNRKTEIDFLRKVQIFIKNNIGLRKLKR